MKLNLDTLKKVVNSGVLDVGTVPIDETVDDLMRLAAGDPVALTAGDGAQLSSAAPRKALPSGVLLPPVRNAMNLDRETEPAPAALAVVDALPEPVAGPAEEALRFVKRRPVVSAGIGAGAAYGLYRLLGGR